MCCLNSAINVQTTIMSPILSTYSSTTAPKKEIYCVGPRSALL